MCLAVQHGPHHSVSISNQRKDYQCTDARTNKMGQAMTKQFTMDVRVDRSVPGTVTVECFRRKATLAPGGSAKFDKLGPCTVRVLDEAGEQVASKYFEALFNASCGVSFRDGQYYI